MQAASSSNPATFRNPRVLSNNDATMSTLPRAINLFGENLFSVLASEAPSSVFISPYCIAHALAMLLNGVEPAGESYAQLQRVVFGAAPANQLSLDALNSELQQLSSKLAKGDDASLTVSDANSVWVAKRYALQQEYSQVLAKFFDARVETITTAQVVNHWVSEATHGKISEIIDDGLLQQATAVLINALYFKGLWASPFKKTATGPVPFRYLQGRSEDVSMMFQTYKANDKDVKVARFHAHLPGQAAVMPAANAGSSWFSLRGSDASGGVPCIAVQLPYLGGEFSAVVAMPEGNLSATAEGAPIQLDSGAPYSAALAGCRAALLAGLGDSSGNNTSERLQWQPAGKQVKLWMPRFEVEYGTSLGEGLQQLGVTKPFQGGDITRIAATPEGEPIGDLVVSDVIHKVYIKVDEAGTEAAAATAVVMLRSAMIREPPALELRFDRPFVFAVLHRGSGAALFVGEVREPEVFGSQEQ